VRRKKKEEQLAEFLLFALFSSLILAPSSLNFGGIHEQQHK
jgi:hypothetical protein